jgi:hypothetical protein
LGAKEAQETNFEGLKTHFEEKKSCQICSKLQEISVFLKMAT